MGNLFSPPKTPKPAAATSSVDLEEEERQRRLDALARARRGRAGTIATSPRGLLVAANWAGERKSLLGE